MQSNILPFPAPRVRKQSLHARRRDELLERLFDSEPDVPLTASRADAIERLADALAARLEQAQQEGLK
jgi:hypothetical protein